MMFTKKTGNDYWGRRKGRKEQVFKFILFTGSDCKSPQVVEIPGTRRSQKQDAPAEGIALKIGDPAHGTNPEVELRKEAKG